MVRLEAKSERLLAITEAYFNSKMVRLEVYGFSQDDNSEFTFQFQNGTIRSSWAFNLAQHGNRISIPKWYD